MGTPLFALTPRGDGHFRFEPGEGGRLIASLANGKEFEVGRTRSGSLVKGSPHLASSDFRPRPVD